MLAIYIRKLWNKYLFSWHYLSWAAHKYSCSVKRAYIFYYISLNDSTEPSEYRKGSVVMRTKEQWCWKNIKLEASSIDNADKKASNKCFHIQNIRTGKIMFPEIMSRDYEVSCSSSGCRQLKCYVCVKWSRFEAFYHRNVILNFIGIYYYINCKFKKNLICTMFVLAKVYRPWLYVI